MKKRILSIVLSLCMVLTLAPQAVFANSTVQQNETPDTAVMVFDVEGWVGEKYDVTYPTITQALEVIKKGTLRMQRSITENVTIPKGSEIKLDLNGFTLTNMSGHTITNNGTLIIMDSLGDGKVDNITNQKAAVYNNEGGSVTLKSGLFTRSDEKSTSSMAGGVNSCSVLVNHGDMNIHDDVTVTIDGMISPLILNGWNTSGEISPDRSADSAQDSSADSSTEKKALLNIEGGVFSGGKENIDNHYYGYVYIYGGTFEEGASDSILNYNALQIENGRFSTKSEKNGTVLSNFKRNDDTCKGLVYVRNGDFTGDILNDKGDMNITGGYFSNMVPSSAIPDGYTCEKRNVGTASKYVVIKTQTTGDKPVYIGSGESMKISSPTAEQALTSITAQYGSSSLKLLSEEVRKEIDGLLSDDNVKKRVQNYTTEMSDNASQLEKPVSGITEAFKIVSFLSSAKGNTLYNQGAKNFSISLKAQLTEMNLTVKPEIKNNNIIVSLVPKKMTFEVHPEVTASNAGGTQVGEPVSLGNDNSQYLKGSNIGFSLPVPSAVSESFAKVTHQSKNGQSEVSYSRIFEAGNIKYTNVNTTHFSTFEVEFVNSLPWSGGYVPIIQSPTIETDDGAKVTMSTDGSKATITVADGYELVYVTVNGVSKGTVTEITGLKTGDIVAVKTKKKQEEPAEPTKEEILAALADQQLTARSKLVTMKNGKKAVKITWYNKNGEIMDFDGVEIFRSTKKNSGYGKKPFYATKGSKSKGYYINTKDVKIGTTYYYRVRGYVIIDGQKYYTDYSLKAIRTVK